MTELVACPHPQESLHRDGWRYGCHACGRWSTLATIEGRPLLELDELDAYRAAHPETRVGMDTESCGSCGRTYDMITSFTCIILDVLRETPLRWETLVSNDDGKMAPIRYATAEEARQGHDALREAARAHVLCLLSGEDMEAALSGRPG
jgi:hypothetical protein